MYTRFRKLKCEKVKILQIDIHVDIEYLFWL